MKYITLEQVLYFHDLLIREFGGASGVRDLKGLESAIYRPLVSFDGIEMYPDIYAKASVIMHGIIKNHPFVDGNKRTGMHSGLFYLRLNDIKIKTKKHEVSELAINISIDKISIKQTEIWLKQHTEK